MSTIGRKVKAHSEVRAFTWLLIFAGCGGEEAPIPTHPERVVLTAANARSITSALWLGHAITESEDILPVQVQALLDLYLPLLAFRPNELPVEIGCRHSGVVVVGGELIDPHAPGHRVGDNATGLFRACEERYGALIPETADGTLRIAVSAVSSEMRTIEATFEDLSIEVADSGPLVQNGALRFGLSADSSTATIESDWFAVSSGAANRLVTGYRLDFRRPTEAEYTLEFRGTQSGGEIAGTVDFETRAPFRGVPSEYPNAGVLEIAGADGTRVVLEARPDGTSVGLTVNDERPIEMTWIELEE